MINTNIEDFDERVKAMVSSLFSHVFVPYIFKHLELTEEQQKCFLESKAVNLSEQKWKDLKDINVIMLGSMLQMINMHITMMVGNKEVTGDEITQFCETWGAQVGPADIKTDIGQTQTTNSKSQALH